MEKKYVTDYPHLMEQWDFEKNNALGIDPSKTAHKSNKKVWWLCSKGHSWNDTVSHRTAGRNCPYCSNHRVLSGYNDLESCCPYLLEEWNYEKNIDTYPSKLTIGSGKKIWWKCKKCKSEWQASINNRVGKGSGCPYCSNLKVKQGFNDLATTRPDLAKEWDYEKNGELKPEMITTFYSKKVWWKCKTCNNSWYISPNSRSKSNCPYCANLKIEKGFNDLATTNPELVKEWDYEKNRNILPTQVVKGSEKKVWWKCQSKGHSWCATINSRVAGRKCPICNSERSTSLPEFAIEYYLKRCGIDVIHSYKKNGYEFDIYIPSKKLAIEYDGYFWHKSKIDKDLEKNVKCKKDGIKLYRIREGLPSLNDTSIDCVIQKNQKDLQETLSKILSEISETNIDINIERDIIDIENLREHKEKESSFLFSNSVLAIEWNYEKNINLRPEHFSKNSNKKVWWKCIKGHEWQSTINHRYNGRGCPYCTGRKVLEGYNDLLTVNPILANEWNYEKNGKLIPKSVTPNSNKKVWWECNHKHEWQATIASRNSGTGCPYCAGQRVIKGANDLQTVNPSLSKEWNYEKNNGLTPMDVMPNSGKKVWWKCEKGHEWEAKIQNRNNGRGCPYCSGRKKLDSN